MKWAPHIPGTSSCPRQPLDALLRGQLDERAGERLAIHLDTCETCQQRLTQLAAEPGWWLDASRWLEPATPDIDPCVDDLGGGELDDFEAAYPSNERDLLESGLLAKSDNPAMIGSLGRYEVKRVIGAGGTGIVMQAIDTELNRTVAIKVLAPTLAAHGPARKRFARESQAVAAVAHENVVAVHHVEAGGRVPYLVMQYIEGDSLQERVIRDGPLDPTTTLRMTAQLAAALTAAHDQGLVHRDVKPANILVGPAGQRVWMTDFGLARAVDDASLTRTGFIAGTPHYMSPEQARGATVRSSSDLFGLGGVVYFMLTGRPPFRAERTLAILNRICTEPHRPVREVNPNVPPAVASLVDRLLAKSVTDRFPNAEAVRAECLHLLASQASPDNDPQVALPGETLTGRSPRRRARTYRAIGTALAIILLAGCLTMMIDLSSQLVRAVGRSSPSPYAASIRPEEPPLEEFATVLSGEAWADPITEQTIPTKRAAGDLEYANSVAVSSFDDVAPSPFTQPAKRRNEPAFDPPAPPPASTVYGSGTNYAPPSGFGTANVNPAVAPSFSPPNPQQPALVAADDVVVEAAIWQLGFHQLEHALTAFASELSASDNLRPLDGKSGENNFDDSSFDDTVRWMETAARDLENATTPGPLNDEPLPNSDFPPAQPEPLPLPSIQFN